MTRTSRRWGRATAAAALAVAALLSGPAMAQLKSYNSQSKDFWNKPPPD